MERDSAIMEALAGQRTAALDQLAIATADLSIALARVRELEAELSQVKSKGASGGECAPS